jgi:hypothetical protein
MKKLLPLLFLGTLGAVSFDHKEAGLKKTGHYIVNGYFNGGSKEVTSARLKDVRRGPQGAGVERVVFDLESAGAVPHFQVNVNPDEGRILISIWADVAYEHDEETIRRAFGRSAHVKSVNILPRVEDGVATVELVLNSHSKRVTKVEAFALTHPSRIILDLL